jgi:drug/metabolite transporter (DMT)-like permease
MQLIALALGGCVALFWGLADSLATLSARRLTTFQTTFISQVVGLLVLNILLIFVHAFNPSITIGLSLANVGTGILAGTFAFVGYLSLYRALEIGPVAITCPLSSTSAVVTLVLSMLILHERVIFPEGIALAAVILGILLVSTRYQDILTLLQQKSSEFFAGKGILWAYLASLTLGCMDFSVGARTPRAGWFPPVYWARLFSVLLLCLCAFYTARQQGPKSKNALLHNMVSLSQEWRGLLLAVIAGILESVGVSTFGLATQIMQPGVIATIGSNYAVVGVLFGVFVFRERLVANQLLGIGLVMCGLAGLAYLRP